MRQFLALQLSRRVQDEVQRLQGELRNRAAGWRWIDPSSIHLTLRFLGEVAPPLDVVAREGWREAAAASSRCTIGLDGLGCFPPRGRPRVLWIGVTEIGSSDHLARLASALEARARAVGFPSVRRPFSPHLTLARAAASARPTAPQEHEFRSSSTVEVDRLTLFRSELLPTGARYTVLDAWPVGAA